MIQSVGFLGRLIKNIIKPLAKSVLIPFGLTAAVSAGDAGTYKKILGSRTNSTKIPNDEMEDLIKIVKFLEDSGLLLKGVSKAFGVEHIPNEIKTFIGDKNIKQIVLEYKHMIQYCADIFVVDLLILCLQEKLNRIYKSISTELLFKK